MTRSACLIVVALSAVILSGCATPAPVPTPTSTPSSTPAVVGIDCPSDPPSDFDAGLHDELIAMLERDQAGRTGGTDTEGDGARTERLKEILAENCWPSFDLVGEDGEDAAWAIAQHSDQDPEFQAQALVLLADAVAAGQGSPGNLAYLSDRIAAGSDQPQQYGTQMGCDESGTPQLAEPHASIDEIEANRAAIGMPPLTDYIAEMTAVCAEVE
jgi:hypothetical protein